MSVADRCLKFDGRIFDTIAAIFAPLSPAVTAAGLIKAVLTIGREFCGWTDESLLYHFIELIAESPLYYLPILLAYSCAKKFGCNIPCALAVGGLLVHPQLMNMSFGMDYSFSVLPIIISVLFMSRVEVFCNRINRKSLRYFLKPSLSIGLTSAFALLVLGPVGILLSEIIAEVIANLSYVAPWLSPALVGALYPIMLLTGTNYGLVPVGINNIVLSGADRFVGPGMLVSNIAQSGAALASAMLIRDRAIKRNYASLSLTALVGISEPALVGVNVKRKSNLPIIVASGGAAGFFMGISGVKRFSTATPGIIALTGYIGDSGYDNLINTVFALIIAFTISFVGTLFSGSEIKIIDDEGEHMSIFKRKQNNICVVSPLAGKAVELTQVSDPTFSEGILGRGVAVVPDNGTLYSPIDGVIESVAETSHAIAISGDNGVDVLIHIGIDTVELKGAPFRVKVKANERVTVGQLLIEFDLDAIRAAGYETVTPIIITNSDEFTTIDAHIGEAKVGDVLINLQK